MAIVETPDFKFSGMYYPQILQDLLVYRRINVPELSDEDPNEPSIQLMRMVALVGHYNNVLLDHVAQEAFLPTARLRESVKSLLSLIGVKVKQDVPATADIIVTLSAVLLSDVVLPALARYASEATSTQAEVTFEVLDEVALSATNAATAIWEDNAGSWTDLTADLVPGGAGATPWGGSASVNDALYVGHDSVMWDKMTTAVASAGSSAAVLEYYDGQIDQENPSAVTDLGGGSIQLSLTTLLGSSNRAGAQVVIRSVSTGAQVTKTSVYSSSTNKVSLTIDEIGLLTPSTSVTDYLVGCVWREVPDVTHVTTSGVKTSSFTLPETLTRRWVSADLSEVLSDAAAPVGTAYWLRWRTVSSGSADAISDIDITAGHQFYKAVAVQGRTYTEALGTSTGGADQQFISLRPGVIETSSRLYIDEGGGDIEWTVADDFLTATSESRVFTVEYDEAGYAIYGFGDGTNGRIPPAGAVLTAVYRVGANVDGNVGAGTITSPRGGNTYVSSVTNPRGASGWKVAEGSTNADLRRLKIAGPKSLQTLDRALTAADLETIATSWTSTDGTSPFVRATTIEGAFGPKTAELLVVEAGTAAAPQATLDALELYLNGDSLLGISGVALLNTEITVSRYTPKTINIVAVVKGGVQASILTALKTILVPSALEDDGTYVYSFAGKVYKERLVAEIFKASAGVRNVVSLTLNGGGDVTLGARELPVYGTLSVTVT